MEMRRDSPPGAKGATLRRRRHPGKQRANEGLEIAARRCDARIEWVNGHASARRFPLEEFR